MPQLLSKYRSRCHVFLCNPGARPTPFMVRPKLGLLAMEAIASFSHLDRMMTEMYVGLCGGSMTLAATIVLGANTKTEKNNLRDAIRSHIKNAEKVEAFDGLTKRVKAAEKARDRLCHWVWGYSNDIEDGLLLADPRDTMSGLTPHDKIYVYFEGDFLSLVSENERLSFIGRAIGNDLLWSTIKDKKEYF